jgi:hypothetical protein
MYISRQRVIDAITHIKKSNNITDTFFDLTHFFDIGNAGQLILKSGVSNGTYMSVTFRCSEYSEHIMLNILFDNLFNYVSPPQSLF